MGSETRKKANKVTIRLDDDELARVRKKAEIVGKSVAAFMRDASLRQRVRSPIIDANGASEIAKQIKAMGNNLNQLTRLANKGELEVIELDEMRLELNRLWQSLNLVLQGAQTVSSITANEKPQSETE